MKSKINIPNPCSEDWNKMTPTAKGAYCGKCQFDVIDFTNKDPDEIRSILADNVGKKTCGHISKTQIEMVNSNYHQWENQPISIFRSKFLYACVMVFGMTLFTGCSDPSQENVVGEVGDVGMFEEDTTASCSSDTLVIDSNAVIDGMMFETIGEIEMETE